MKKQTSIDAYLKTVAPDKRAALENLRKAIRAAAPDAEECFSYGLPAFRNQGGLVAGFGASANHCSYYPMSGSVTAALAGDLAKYETSKGAIRFSPQKPLPAALVKKLVKARIAENEPKKPAPRAPKKPATKAATPTSGATLDAALAALERAGSKKVRDEMGPRYGIVAKKAFGVPMNKIMALAKSIGTDHALADALWKSGWYEARLLASMIDDPALVTTAQMDRWAKDFDNWGVVDTVSFKLFDRAPDAFAMVDRWAKRRGEFEKRAAFALLACLALHGKGGEADFLKRLPLIEKAASDERNFVKKGVSWALRAIGARKSPALRAAARDLARRLAASEDAAARWIGKDALRDFASAASARRLSAGGRNSG